MTEAGEHLRDLELMPSWNILESSTKLLCILTSLIWLDHNHYIRYRLSRGVTKYQDGKHYRGLSKLNRDPAKILYVSGHAFDSSLQPENCVPIEPCI
ncbi:hypothetical protein SLEP1_g51768 [Rubroshorea leprosula]|uniref:FCP1 homology domain-containing protein n=1 Tax=Rubroshorea leprosula TaxID=152421 RepID=A0AAV5M6G9_9ROSI|nr:hypothetical protein SLEP1_g51768 [Rubroshorea leprosula]